MDDAVSLARLKRTAGELEEASTHRDTVHERLVREVRVADSNGVPKTRIAETIGVNRETVSRWCKGDA